MRLLTIAAALAVAFTLSACNSVPIQNVDRAAVLAPQGKTMTREQVRAAIIRAGASLRWQMADEGPNMIVATLNLRTHMAVVEIPYTTETYSIKYRSSVNLYEANGMIHKNYNSWIQNLSHGINTQLSLL